MVPLATEDIGRTDNAAGADAAAEAAAVATAAAAAAATAVATTVKEGFVAGAFTGTESAEDKRLGTAGMAAASTAATSWAGSPLSTALRPRFFAMTWAGPGMTNSPT